jgi:hypothetical protein
MIGSDFGQLIATIRHPNLAARMAPAGLPTCNLRESPRQRGWVLLLAATMALAVRADAGKYKRESLKSYEIKTVGGPGHCGAVLIGGCRAPHGRDFDRSYGHRSPRAGTRRQRATSHGLPPACWNIPNSRIIGWMTKWPRNFSTVTSIRLIRPT